MQHHRDLASLQLEGVYLTIGSFDGVHRGHQALIEALVAASQAAGAPSAVMTFYPHPSVVLRHRQPAFYITSPDEKAELLGGLGIDHVITQPFDERLSKVEAPDFLDLLDRHLGIRSLWAGEDFALGYQRRGNRHFLERAGAERGFEFRLVEPFMLEGEVVSSTRVREALRSGDVARVASYLGRQFCLPGVVVPGAGRGRDLGYPTANLEIWEERAHPGEGVYACTVQAGEGSWKAVVNIGTRPTFEPESESPVIEAHLLDFEGDLGTKELRINFAERLRYERKFPDEKSLVMQIGRDIRRAREILR